MPRVPAHTNQVGTFTAPALSAEYYTGNLNIPSLKRTRFSSISHQFSSKSPTQFGPRAAGGAFIGATDYSRSVTKMDSNGSFDFHLLPLSDGRRYWGSDARVFPGFKISSQGVGVTTTISANLENRCVTEARLKLTEMKVNVGTALGEAKTTIRMICDRIVSLASLIRSLRNGNFGLAARQLSGHRRGSSDYGRTAAQLFLEWKYGWSPLVSDIVGGVEQLREGFRGKDLLFSVERTLTQPADPAAFLGPSSPATSSVVTTGEAWESCMVKLYGRVRTSAANLNSLGLINPLSLGWELLTMSFVIDWLIPIGNWLESLTSTVGIEFAGGFKTNRVHADVQGTLERYESQLVAGQVPDVRWQVTGMSRTAYKSWPWALPYWVNPLTTNNLTSAMALLKQRS